MKCGSLAYTLKLRKGIDLQNSVTHIFQITSSA